MVNKAFSPWIPGSNGFGYDHLKARVTQGVTLSSIINEFVSLIRGARILSVYMTTNLYILN